MVGEYEPVKTVDDACKADRQWPRHLRKRTLCAGNCVWLERRLAQEFPYLRQELTRTIRLRHKVITARRTRFVFISTQSI